MMSLRLSCSTLVLAVFALAIPAANAQQFSYVGVLEENGAGAVGDGTYDLRFRLFDAESAGVELAAANELADVAVAHGNYAVVLDFGTAVLAPDAWLQLEVRASGDATYDVLLPRQRITGVPLALFAEHAGGVEWGDVASMPGGFADAIDDDTLAMLACDEGAIPSFDAGAVAWQCGAAGVDGRTILGGAGAPAADLGADGDFYIDSGATALYGPKTGGDWGAPTALTGPQGPQGEPGLDAGEEAFPAARIGRLVFDPEIIGEPDLDGLALHALSLTFVAPDQFGDLIARVDPGSAAGELFAHAFRSPDPLLAARLGFDLAAPDYIALENSATTLFALSEGQSPTDSLAELTLAYASLTLRQHGQQFSASRTGGAVMQKAGVNCSKVLSLLVVDPPIGANDQVAVELASAVPHVGRSVSFGLGSPVLGTPIFDPIVVQLPHPLDASGGHADHAGVCALEFAVTGAVSANPIELRRYDANGALLWTLVLRDAGVGSWALSTDAAGTIRYAAGLTAIEFEFTADGTRSCWNVETQTSC